MNQAEREDYWKNSVVDIEDKQYYDNEDDDEAIGYAYGNNDEDED
jgi:hypothetical protein